jgi:5-methyltetrahydrofolate--homocysteine methyltransferase
LQTAVDVGADMVGLSGLITPSLDEMVFVAREMERRKMAIPLLIGGATTSRPHTAVKIAPEYGSQPVVHVVDASRAVDVVSRLLSTTERATFDREIKTDQERVRQQHAALKRRPLLAWPDATKNRLDLRSTADDLAMPSFTGRRLVDVSLETIVPYIDWTFFFAAWELKGRFPAILDHPQYGPSARELYDHGRRLLDRIIAERLLTVRGVYGFWPAHSLSDDIVIYEPGPAEAGHYTDQREQPDRDAREVLRFNMLRQQEQQSDGNPNLSLADFVAPNDGGLQDSLGAFAITAGIGAEDLAAAYERRMDDYHAIMVKALADRLAEASAEWLHARARADWGYGTDEHLSNEDLIAGRYRGIRPAFGYPACPDHSEKYKLFDLLQADRAGLSLTESAAMAPAASVSGLYFAHPHARYFTVGRIGRDQVEDYAARKGVRLEEAERWLRPNLGYDT